ncbi:MAG: alpha/beta hydrolase [Lachnospiraceae bacterium]|nr:alpha/beta hydrolase [Lachnospiraceae bacterium]
MKKSAKIGLAAFAGSAAGSALLIRELYRYSFTREGSPFIDTLLKLKGEPSGHDDAYYEYRNSLKEAALARPQIRMTMPSERGQQLAGFYYPSESGDGRHIAFVVHGYHSDHAETVGMFLDMYLRNGFDVFAPDNTAHGESEGRAIGFDVFESQDALQWIEYLKARKGSDVRIILHGLSLGGATVMKMSDQVGPEVRFIVEDSGYTEAQSLLKRSPCHELLREIHRQLSGCDVRESDVRPHLERAFVPILFVQGTEDKLVPAENGPYLFDFYQGPKDCLFVPGARHIEAIYVDPEGYEKKIKEMIEKYMK